MKTDQSLTSEASLDLIARMLRNTQERFERGMGTPFLIFGYLCLAASLAVWSLIKATGDYRWTYLYFSIPLIGSVFMLRFLSKRPKTVSTFFDRATSQVWIVLGTCCLLLSLYAGFLNRSFPILTVISLLMFSGEAITGGILRLRYLRIIGFIGIVLSFTIPLLSGYEVIVFGALSFLIMVIPGHIMNAQARKRAPQSLQADGHV